ncbi:MAG: NADP-dependent phosphogluconate dehydrogenase [Gammaproteobacteria bacterium]|nr:NADP-dependent phosphogluconate dehydrogenase [Gammaproteobacteria bacterium]
MGVVGLGVMGQNLVLNMVDKGFTVAVHDPWTEARDRFAGSLPLEAKERVHLVQGPMELVYSLSTPRTILIMVKAGDPVDAVIDSLLPHLAPGDTLIDGGNSHYRDTIRREASLTDRNVFFIGLGVSGGEKGARYGPSMMAGGERTAYENSRTVIEAIAARFNGEPCCALVGGDGAGHFVKMLHNGIEYGIMQAIAEAYVLLRDLVGLAHEEMADLFTAWNRTELGSYLVEITAEILRRKDDLGDGPLVEAILDTAGQKGTGRWSSEAALACGIPTPTITEAVFARSLASLKAERVAAASLMAGPDFRGTGDAIPVESIRQALQGSIIATFSQGLALIEKGGREHGWDIDLSVIAAIWREGCVIRAGLLDAMSSAYRQSEKPANLMCAPKFRHMLAESQQGWRQTVSAATISGIPVPAIGSSLTYYDSYRSDRLWANMIQAQRDYFGAHTYERLDRAGSFHTRW